MCIGSVNGQFGLLHRRITSIVEKSGPFDFVLCCGNFGVEGMSLAEIREFPLPVYYIGDGPEEKNLFPLGESGVSKVTGGIRLGFVNQEWDSERYTAGNERFCDVLVKLCLLNLDYVRMSHWHKQKLA